MIDSPLCGNQHCQDIDLRPAKLSLLFPLAVVTIVFVVAALESLHAIQEYTHHVIAP